MKARSDSLYYQLGEIITTDLNIDRRKEEHLSDLEIINISIASVDLIKEIPIVYTAFDGDHFHLCGHMRRFALKSGCVPANPESILGYKDTVMAHGNKKEVLYDDLTVLRNCDQLWVFSEQEPHPASLQNLAEGVVVEILYFLRRMEKPLIYFISPMQLIENEDPLRKHFNYSYEDCINELHPEHGDDVLELANSKLRVDEKLVPLTYHIIDPFDFKYSHWLRAYAYSRNRVPLVPGLAIQMSDFGRGYRGLGQIVAGWMKLGAITSYALLFPPMSPYLTESTTAKILKHAWMITHDPTDLEYATWVDYPIPKARLGCDWPITKREQRLHEKIGNGDGE